MIMGIELYFQVIYFRQYDTFFYNRSALIRRSVGYSSRKCSLNILVLNESITKYCSSCFVLCSLDTLLIPLITFSLLHYNYMF